jgi:hypothetical protein
MKSAVEFSRKGGKAPCFHKDSRVFGVLPKGRKKAVAAE